MVLSAPIGPESRRASSGAVLSVRWTEWQWTSSDWFVGQLALYRHRETQPSGGDRGCMAHSAQPFSPTDLRCRSGRGCGRLAASPRSAKRTVGQLSEQLASEDDPQGSNGRRTMSLGANSVTHVGGNPAAGSGLIIQHGRRGQRGKNGSAPPAGTHRRRYIK
jgi:hypothetical protein